MCGSGDHAFCIPSGFSCPVVALDVNKLTSNTANYITRLSSSSSTGPMTLFLVRQSKYISVDNYKPLLRKGGKYLLQTGSFNNAVLLSQKDTRFSNLANPKSFTTTENEVFLQAFGQSHKNKFPSQDQTTKIYRTNSDYDFNYFGRPYIKWTLNQPCRDILSSLFIAKDKFNIAKNMQTVIFIINILVLVILGFIFPIMGILNTCGYDLPCIKGDGAEEYKRLN